MTGIDWPVAIADADRRYKESLYRVLLPKLDSKIAGERITDPKTIELFHADLKARIFGITIPEAIAGGGI